MDDQEQVESPTIRMQVHILHTNVYGEKIDKIVMCWIPKCRGMWVNGKYW